MSESLSIVDSWMTLYDRLVALKIQMNQDRDARQTIQPLLDIFKETNDQTGNVLTTNLSMVALTCYLVMHKQDETKIDFVQSLFPRSLDEDMIPTLNMYDMNTIDLGDPAYLMELIIIRAVNEMCKWTMTKIHVNQSWYAALDNISNYNDSDYVVCTLTPPSISTGEPHGFVGIHIQSILPSEEHTFISVQINKKTNTQCIVCKPSTDSIYQDIVWRITTCLYRMYLFCIDQSSTIFGQGQEQGQGQHPTECIPCHIFAKKTQECLNTAINNLNTIIRIYNHLCHHTILSSSFVSLS
jgi:hypothetical protein